ncbi:MAG: phosphoenolpyruvate carboxylase, partial [Phycisphaeraceae bacterium]|nr:phosphoenolpyruvate carboxylase [Phycisphaeraceae bacterium]
RWPDLAEQLDQRNPHEKYRHWLAVIRYRLERTATASDRGPWPDGAYRGPDELAADIELVADSLRDAGHDELAGGLLQDWLDRVAVFGFHLVRLDIRDDARKLQEVADELLSGLGYPGYLEADEPARLDMLTAHLDPEAVNKLGLENLSDPAEKVVSLYRLIHRTVDRFGGGALGALIASMTHEGSDVMVMQWLTRLAAVLEDDADNPVCLPVVPLFETIDDLNRSGEILGGLFERRIYREHLAAVGDRQMCMVGYSDSTKDGGFFAANWELYEGQRKLAAVCREADVRLTVFHGRGGALGRGGGPAARGILSLPPESVDASIRITEQGEVLAERYDDPEIAFRHLEQVTWATLLVSRKADADDPDDWREAMDRGEATSRKLYRDLIGDDGFLDYFDRATPIKTIETLPIGSRPSRRSGERRLEDLRAIPYTFAWTQSRHMITAFYGLGTALEAAAGDGDEGWEQLAGMYRQWPMFKAMIDNAELALAKADMEIAHAYARQVDAGDTGERIWNQIRQEYERSRSALLRVTGREELLEAVPWLQRSIRVRNPYVDPLNFIQVELMRRDRDGQSVDDLLRQSVQGIASGLRTTG